MAKKLNSKWFTGDKTESEKEETRQLLSLCKPVLDNLAEMCYNTVKNTEAEMLTKINYDKPSWSAYQADLNGYKRAYKEILTMIEAIEER